MNQALDWSVFLSFATGRCLRFGERESSFAPACSSPRHAVLLAKSTGANMSVLWEELTAGLSDSDHLLRVVIRLAAAILCGGLIGLQRESVGKSAGLRTHALVSLGTTFVVVACSATAM